MIALLGWTWGCGEPPPLPKPQPASPTHTAVRGPFVVETYVTGSLLYHGAGGRRCVVRVDGAQVGDTYKFCEPSPDFAAPAVAVESRVGDRALFMAPDGHATPLVLSFGRGHSSQCCGWDPDGHHYVAGTQVVDLNTGGIDRLPPYVGQLLAFSPDRSAFASLQSTPDRWLHVVQVSTRKTTSTPLPREQFRWAWNSSLPTPRHEQIRWRQQGGRWTADPVPDPMPAD